ncbi:ribbon-helix-helix protein, CopG family [Acidianus sp. HS-5]|uniref:ribbon-helix-helix protein, CopG family n=1 Tax=Acidianus sp. HS-5 TaxID=2886040 RepID=UPI001F00491E|nr:ribbon-helix-helix protein, CopG family [Acidianus sp. HS-5]BDC17337.1 hypothetical protein HS5_02270 [Acidianus sp. HS-5]
MTLVIKRINEEKLREFKAEAIRRGLTLSEAIEQAIDLWLNKARDDDEREINNRVFENMKKEILSKYWNKYVVIAKGQFIGAFDTLDEVRNTLKSLNVSQAIVFNPSEDKRMDRRKFIAIIKAEKPFP